MQMFSSGLETCFCFSNSVFDSLVILNIQIKYTYVFTQGPPHTFMSSALCFAHDDL